MQLWLLCPAHNSIRLQVRPEYKLLSSLCMRRSAQIMQTSKRDGCWVTLKKVVPQNWWAGNGHWNGGSDKHTSHPDCPWQWQYHTHGSGSQHLKRLSWQTGCLQPRTDVRPWLHKYNSSDQRVLSWCGKSKENRSAPSIMLTLELKIIWMRREFNCHKQSKWKFSCH